MPYAQTGVLLQQAQLAIDNAPDIQRPSILPIDGDLVDSRYNYNNYNHF